MNTEARFKYQAQIDELLAIGCQLPRLFAPNGLQACRFAFSGEAHPNHIPQYMSNPKRMLQDMGKGKANISLLSLSCFATADNGHFDFYEYEACDLNKSFQITKVLMEEKPS